MLFNTYYLCNINGHFQNETDSTSSTRFITEIVVVLQPIDFILAFKTLKNYYMVLEPLLKIPSLNPQLSGQSKIVKSRSYSAIPLNNRSIPLVYIECRGFRMVVPSVELEESKYLHNVCMFQMECVNLSPNPENPICRQPCKPDVYQQAAQARILYIPGKYSV